MTDLVPGDQHTPNAPTPSLSDYVAALDYVTDGVCIYDRNWTVRYVNLPAARIKGLPPEQIIGRNTWEMNPAAVGTRFHSMYIQAMEQGEPFTLVEWYAPWNRWIEASGHPTPDGLMVFFRDVSERRQQEEEREHLLESERWARTEAERAVRLKDDFLATLSHELRTPLNAIIGYARLLRREAGLPAEARGWADVIERNAAMQARIIEDLLDMSRISAGKLKLEVASIDLRTVAMAAIETVRPAIEAKRLQLTTEFCNATGNVRADYGRIQQIVWNLLSNAIKFTPVGGRVQVKVDRVDSYARVIVSDNGRGISPEFMPFLFDRFRQADAALTRQQPGLGLGLAIVKNLVEMHGGRVRAESEGESLGSSFIVELPLLLVADAPATHAGAPSLLLNRLGEVVAPPQSVTGPLELAHLQGMTALVVDDEHDARDLIRRLLGETAMQVVTASSAAEAMACLERRRVDLLVSDIGMPGEDGYQLVRRVRQLPAPLSRLPAIAVTAFSRPGDRDRAVAAGFDSHLSKPIDAQLLLATVAALTENSGVSHS